MSSTRVEPIVALVTALLAASLVIAPTLGGAPIGIPVPLGDPIGAPVPLGDPIGAPVPLGDPIGAPVPLSLNAPANAAAAEARQPKFCSD